VPATGTLNIVALPAGATYTLRDLIDGHVVQGYTPMNGPLSLPVGAYAVEVSSRYCASYFDTVQVASATPTPDLHVRLVCGR
jgi:hypothetical protein